jgi:hypothetical protein
VFNWEDSESNSPEQLARKFIERFSLIAAAGQGKDPDYVAWYEAMLKATEPDGFIYAFADWETPTDQMPAFGVAESVVIPLPPPGKAGDGSPGRA